MKWQVGLVRSKKNHGLQSVDDAMGSTDVRRADFRAHYTSLVFPRCLEHNTNKTAAVAPSVLQLAGTVSNVRLEHGQARSLFVQPTVRFDLR